MPRPRPLALTLSLSPALVGAGVPANAVSGAARVAQADEAEAAPGDDGAQLPGAEARYPGVSGSVSLGVLATSGNTETETANGELDVELGYAVWRHRFGFQAHRSSEDGETTAERYARRRRATTSSASARMPLATSAGSVTSSAPSSAGGRLPSARADASSTRPTPMSTGRPVSVAVHWSPPGPRTRWRRRSSGSARRWRGTFPRRAGSSRPSRSSRARAIRTPRRRPRCNRGSWAPCPGSSPNHSRTTATSPPGPRTPTRSPRFRSNTPSEAVARPWVPYVRGCRGGRWHGGRTATC